MKDILTYKDFIGSVHFNADDEIFFGKIEGINDLVTFEGKSVKDIQQAFKEAVHDYMDICEKNNVQMYKSYKGSFNIRVTPMLHKKAVEKALLLGIPLNQLVQNALEKEVMNNK